MSEAKKPAMSLLALVGKKKPKGDEEPDADDEDGGDYDAAVNEFLDAMDSGDREAAVTAFKAAVMSCK